MKLNEAQKRKIRQSAKGEACTFNLPAICNYDPETVVLCHLPDESHGMALKSFELSSAYGCADCHKRVDNVAHKNLLPDSALDWYMRRAQTRTLKRLLEKRIIQIK